MPLTAFYSVFALATLKKYQIATGKIEIDAATSSSIQAAGRKCRPVKRLECLVLVHRTPERSFYQYVDHDHCYFDLKRDRS